jgi:hypothetical protein
LKINLPWCGDCAPARLPAARISAAREMLQALGLYRSDNKAVPRIAAAIGAREELAKEFAELFA